MRRILVEVLPKGSSRYSFVKCNLISLRGWGNPYIKNQVHFALAKFNFLGSTFRNGMGENTAEQSDKYTKVRTLATQTNAFKGIV